MQATHRMMKNQTQQTRNKIMLLAGLAGLAWLTGCQNLQYTAFAPVEARIESVPSRGAQYLVVVNASGQVLHNCHFRAYVWYDRTPTYVAGPNNCFPKYFPRVTYTFTASESRWETNGMMHFGEFHLRSKEMVILFPVSRVQIIGQCDEGRFREDWEADPSGRLQLIGPAAHSAQP